MKQIVLATALLLTLVGTTTRKYADPFPECPPYCGNSGNVLAAR